MIYVLVIGLGLIIGSFLNVVILRYNTGRLSAPRSGCLTCGKRLLVRDLFPVISFLILGGKCRHCKCSISIQYPIVEALTSLLFLVSWYISNPQDVLYWALLLIDWAIISILIVISVYDIYHKIIPDVFSYTFIILAFFRFFVENNNQYLIVSPEAMNLLAGVILSLPFALLWFVSKGKWIGFGDAKLAFGIGMFLGLVFGLSAIVLGFWIGAIWGIVAIVLGKAGLLSKKKQLTMKSEVPFAPFLIVATLAVYIFHIDVLGIAFLFGA